MNALLGVLALLTFLTAPASAHPLDDSTIAIKLDATSVDLRWEISLRDLDPVVDLDRDGSGRITADEFDARRDAIAGYALPRLRISGDGQSCGPDGAVDQRLSERADGPFVLLHYRLACSRPPARLDIAYGLFFDVHPDHRGLVTIAAETRIWNGVLSPENRTMSVTTGAEGAVGFASFFATGIIHMLEGIDHLLFLAVVLLPILLAERRPGLPGLMRPPLEAAKILTAFTLAHGLTLWLAVLGIVSLPSRLVESAIALSIALTAIDNVVPFLGGRRWLVAFGFGLVHGLGFASALGPLSLPSFELASALLAFNLGLETAQFGVALVALPIGYLIGAVAAARRAALPLGSAVAGVIATLWFAERAFDFFS